MRSLWFKLIAVSFVLLLAGSAFADEGAPAAGSGSAFADEGAPAAGSDNSGGAPGIVLNQGQFAVRGMLELNLSTDAVGKPFSIAPDLYYGVLPQLQLGLIHSGYGSTGFLGGVGNGLCVTGKDNGCGKVYNSLGLQADYAFLTGPLSVGAQGGVYFRSFDPMMLAFKVAVMARYMLGPVMIDFAPGLFIGATERDAGNKEELMLPLTLTYMVMPGFGAGVQTGMTGPLDGFGNAWRLPLSFHADYWINQNMGLMLSFTLGALAGGDLVPTGADLRMLNLAFTYRM